VTELKLNINELNPEKIQSLFDKTIYDRGLNYYKLGYVIDAEIYGNHISGRVKGSESKPYITFFDLEKGIGRCNCPYEINCKHAVALLLRACEIYNADKIPVLPEKPADDRKTTIALNSSASFDYHKLKNEAHLASRKENERFSVAFEIRRSQSDSNLIALKPVCRYLKKDGTYGRTEKYERHKITEQLNDDELKLLLMMPMYAQNIEIPVLSIIPYLKRANKIAFIDAFTNKKADTQFMPFKGVEISFKLGSLYNNYPEFIPELRVIINGKTSITPLTIIQSDGYSTVCRDESGMYFYSTGNYELNSFIKNHLSRSGKSVYGEIKSYKEYSLNHPGSNLKINFEAEKLEVIKASGNPLLEIENSYNSCTLKLFFDYNGREFPHDRREIILNPVQKQTGDTFTVYERNMDYENSISNYIKAVINEAGIEVSKHQQPFYRYSPPTDSINISVNLHDFLFSCGKKLFDADINLRLKKDGVKIRSAGGKVAFRIQPGIDWFSAKAEYIDDDNSKQDIEIDYSLLKSGFLKTKNSYVYISEKDIEKINQLQNRGMNNRGEIEINRLDFPAIEMISAETSSAKNREVEEIRAIYSKLKTVSGIGKYSLPQKFNGKLRDYQAEGYNWLNFLREHSLNGCLADDMGLGKTVQTLAMLQKMKEEKKLRPALLIVPVSTVPNWENEIKRFTPSLKFIRHLGQFRKSDRDEIITNDIIITSYHTLRIDMSIFSDMEFSIMVLDESQNVKNASSQAFKTVKEIRTKHRLALSGTPIENNTGELWALFDILNPGLLGNKDSFKKNYANPIEKYGNKDAAARLRSIIFPFILRRKKDMVAKELPEKEEITVISEMDVDQKKAYEALRKEFSTKIKKTIEEKGKDKSAIEIFEALLRLRQIALFPVIASEQFKNVSSCKFEMLKDMLDDLVSEGRKVLIFSQFVQSLNIIKEEIEQRKLPFSYIDGSTKNRGAEIDKFQNNPDINIFLLSLKAGGVGINLTSADCVILFDPWWNPALEAQAVDRAHRIGQTKKVTAFRMIVKDTIEEKILALQDKKRALVNDLITEEASFFKSLSGDDIMDLFS